MNTIFIVDQDASGLAGDLNAFAQAHQHDVRFIPFTSLEKMFAHLPNTAPDLVLLHHHWDGLTIGEVLQRICDSHCAVRVIVFTGQALNMHELIECVRFGVADYWPERGALESSWMFTKFDHYCSSPAWTIETLRLSSGSLQHLLRESLAKADRGIELDRALSSALARVRELESQERAKLQQTAMGAMSLGTTAIIMIAAFLILNSYTMLPVRWIFSFVGMIGLLALFLDGRIREAVIKWRQGSATIKGK